eukprot:Hpha_TRINITY_DN16515_c2_g1::TRINITY_DN16515_c2_g1_i1::g.133882::m.133882
MPKQFQRMEMRKIDFRRELMSLFGDATREELDRVIQEWESGVLSQEGARLELQKSARLRAQRRFEEQEDGGSTEGRPVLIYYTSQTGDRKVRDDCRRVRMLFDALSVPHLDVDVTAGGSHHMSKAVLTRASKANGGKKMQFPVVFVGTGKDAVYAGTFDSLSELVASEKEPLYIHIEKLGYVHKDARAPVMVTPEGYQAVVEAELKAKMLADLDKQKKVKKGGRR